jgi:hypothetical protein
LLLLRAIPAKAEIQGFQSPTIYWTPVFTGVTDKNHFFAPFGEGWNYVFKKFHAAFR